MILKRGAVGAWPPPGQPRLPLEETAINTLALLASGLMLWRARRAFARCARARAAPARDRDRARRVLRAVPGRRVGGADRAGPHAHLEQARQLLLPDRGPARAARASPGSRCSRGPGGGCAAACSPAARSRRRRCSGSSSSVCGRCSTCWSTREPHRARAGAGAACAVPAARRRGRVLGLLRGRRREPQGVPAHDAVLERAPARA